MLSKHTHTYKHSAGCDLQGAGKQAYATEAVIYELNDGSRHFHPHSNRCILKIERINHHSLAVYGL